MYVSIYLSIQMYLVREREELVESSNDAVIKKSRPNASLLAQYERNSKAAMKWLCTVTDSVYKHPCMINLNLILFKYGGNKRIGI